VSDNGNRDLRSRIDVCVCHCGANIAAIVHVTALTEYAAKLPSVVVVGEYKYMCLDRGQELIRQDIRDHNLNRIVVASCSPLMHEPTFRGALARSGINPFLLQMVNIREHVSWVHTNKAEATAKAKDLVRAVARRVRLHEPLEKRRVEINPNVLVAGGGIAGIHAALTVANSGKHVFLGERQPSIGGHMACFDKTFPTLVCGTVSKSSRVSTNSPQGSPAMVPVVRSEFIAPTTTATGSMTHRVTSARSCSISNA
jgi:heterodisulfide reductase subunit A2